MERSDLEAPLRLLNVLWIAFTMVIVMAAVMAYALLTTGTIASGAIQPSVLTMIAPVLMVLMAGGLVLGRRLEVAIPRGAPSTQKIQRYVTARIIAMATQEGPALAIMALSLLAGSRNWIIGAAVAGVWTTFLARARREDLEALLRG